MSLYYRPRQEDLKEGEFLIDYYFELKDYNPKIHRKRVYCDDCKEMIFIKDGPIRARHVSHYPTSKCKNFKASKMSEWHYRFTKAFENNEITLDNHRADIILQSGIVIEAQHSPISPENISERESFYDDLMWVVDNENRIAHYLSDHTHALVSVPSWSIIMSKNKTLYYCKNGLFEPISYLKPPYVLVKKSGFLDILRKESRDSDLFSFSEKCSDKAFDHFSVEEIESDTITIKELKKLIKSQGIILYGFEQIEGTDYYIFSKDNVKREIAVSACKRLTQIEDEKKKAITMNQRIKCDSCKREYRHSNLNICIKCDRKQKSLCRDCNRTIRSESWVIRCKRCYNKHKELLVRDTCLDCKKEFIKKESYMVRCYDCYLKSKGKKL